MVFSVWKLLNKYLNKNQGLSSRLFKKSYRCFELFILLHFLILKVNRSSCLYLLCYHLLNLLAFLYWKDQDLRSQYSYFRLPKILALLSTHLCFQFKVLALVLIFLNYHVSFELTSHLKIYFLHENHLFFEFHHLLHHLLQHHLYLNLFIFDCCFSPITTNSLAMLIAPLLCVRVSTEEDPSRWSILFLVFQ